MNERLDRRLVAVMFTDVVGYTALIQADERLGVDKRDRYMGALETHHDAFGGTIVQRLGDGSMSMFASSLDAVLVEDCRGECNEIDVRFGAARSVDHGWRKLRRHLLPHFEAAHTDRRTEPRSR